MSWLYFFLMQVEVFNMWKYIAEPVKLIIGLGHP